MLRIGLIRVLIRMIRIGYIIINRLMNILISNTRQIFVMRDIFAIAINYFFRVIFCRLIFGIFYRFYRIYQGSFSNPFYRIIAMLSMNSRQMPTPSCKSWPFSRLRSGPGGIPSHPTPVVGKSEEAGEPESSRDRPRGSFSRYHDGLLTSRILASHEAVLLMFLVEHMEHMWGEFRERRPSLYAVPTDVDSTLAFLDALHPSWIWWLAIRGREGIYAGGPCQGSRAYGSGSFWFMPLSSTSGVRYLSVPRPYSSVTGKPGT